MGMNSKQTTYTMNLTCDDMGEYDAIFMAQVGQVVMHLMKDISSVGYSLSLSRYRPEERQTSSVPES
jgi:hypothetical protein